MSWKDGLSANQLQKVPNPIYTLTHTIRNFNREKEMTWPKSGATQPCIVMTSRQRSCYQRGGCLGVWTEKERFGSPYLY